MKGWLKPRRLPSVDSEVMVSAHLTERVLMEPVTSMRAARLRWNQFILKGVAHCSERKRRLTPSVCLACVGHADFTALVLLPVRFV